VVPGWSAVALCAHGRRRQLWSSATDWFGETSAPHGFRAAELADLRWDPIDFRGAMPHARRIKNGLPSTHPIQGDELRTLRRLQRESEASPFVPPILMTVFVSHGQIQTLTRRGRELCRAGSDLQVSFPPRPALAGSIEHG
jgi:integrase